MTHAEPQFRLSRLNLRDAQKFAPYIFRRKLHHSEHESAGESLRQCQCESFMKTLKREEIYANDYVDLEHLRRNIENFIEAYYNRCRLHSALAYQPPEEFEQQLELTTINAGATMSFFRHGEDYQPDSAVTKTKSGPQTAPLSTIGLDESPAGYSLASCSPAELDSASPATGDSELKSLLENEIYLIAQV